MFDIVLFDFQEIEQEIVVLQEKEQKKDDEVDILMGSDITLFCLFYIVLFDFQETEQEIDDEVVILMSSDIVILHCFVCFTLFCLICRKQNRR